MLNNIAVTSRGEEPHIAACHCHLRIAVSVIAAAAHCPLPATCHLPPTAHRPPSAAHCPPPTTCHPPPATRCLPPPTRHMPPAARRTQSRTLPLHAITHRCCQETPTRDTANKRSLELCALIVFLILADCSEWYVSVVVLTDQVLGNWIA
jgi:hypothetical protein